MKNLPTFLMATLVVTVGCSEKRDVRANRQGTETTQAQTRAAEAPEQETPAAAAEDRQHEVVIPAGTVLSLTLDTSLSSDHSRIYDAVHATLARPVVLRGETAIQAGARMIGAVVEAHQSGRVKGRASISVRFDRLQLGEGYAIRTARISRVAPATKGEDATKVGIGAGAGAVIGAIAGGGKGAAVGGAIGAGAGTGVVLATRGRDVYLPRGTTLKTTLEQPVTIQVSVDRRQG